MNKNAFSRAIGRKAIRLKIGGFRPVDDPQASWFGKVLLAKPNEVWPMSNGRPMLALCQINLQTFPFKPEAVKDLAFITLFIDPATIPDSTDPNGSTWCLRTYKNVDGLVSLAQLPVVSPIKPFQMMPEVIEADFPMYEDCPLPIPGRFENTYQDLFPNADGCKFGGWPSLIQGEIVWPSFKQYLAAPMFVFQVDSVEKAHWQWGDNGLAYFGRQTAAGHEQEWQFSWQCY